MKKALLPVIALAYALSACHTAPSSQEKQKTPDSMVMIPTDTMIRATDTAVQPVLVESWKAFEANGGKYASDIGLLELDPLARRLKALLGKHQKDFMQRFSVAPPIEIETGILFNEGCKPHNCMLDEAAIAIDMQKDQIYAGIAKDRKVMLFSEKGDTAYPEKLLSWKKKFEE